VDTFFKGNEHHAALMRNLGGSVGGGDPDQNVAVNIRRSTRDKTLEPVRRAAVDKDPLPHRTANALTDHLHRTEDDRDKNRGAFDKLLARVRDAGANGEMAKAAAYKLGDYSIEQVYADLKSVPVGSTAGASKALGKSMAKLARSLGNATLAKSLESGYGTDSATLTGGSAIRKQSLSKRAVSTTVGGDPVPTGEQILKAASAALYAGQIDATDAQQIQHQVNTRGTCDDALLKKLRGEDAIATPRLLTKSQCHAAASKGLQTGAITGAEAMHVDIALSLDKPVDDGVMAKLRALHGGK
jgi:hypothetical protein